MEHCSRQGAAAGSFGSFDLAGERVVELADDAALFDEAVRVT
jgi:hypothetical protein